MHRQQSRLMGLAVILAGVVTLLGETREASAFFTECFYEDCEDSCPSQSSWITFCEEHSTEAGCSLSNGGCQPGGGSNDCQDDEVYLYCNGPQQ